MLLFFFFAPILESAFQELKDSVVSLDELGLSLCPETLPDDTNDTVEG